MIIINSMKHLEAVLCGEQMIVNLNSGTYKLQYMSGFVEERLIRDQIQLPTGTKIFDVKQFSKVLECYKRVDGTCCSVEQYKEVDEQYQKLLYDDDYNRIDVCNLSVDEFEQYRKLKDELCDYTAVYKTKENRYTELEINFIGDVCDGDVSDFIDVSYSEGLRYFDNSDCCYRVHVSKIAKDEHTKILANLQSVHNFTIQNTNNNIRFTQIDHQYLYINFPNNKKPRCVEKEFAVSLATSLESAKSKEAETRKMIRLYITTYINSIFKNVTKTESSTLLKELDVIRDLVGSVKAFKHSEPAHNKSVRLINDLRETFVNIINS